MDPTTREAILKAIHATKDRRTQEWVNATYGQGWLGRLIFVTSPLANKNKAGKSPARPGWQNPIGGDTRAYLTRLTAHLNHESLPGNIGLHIPPGVIALDFDSKKDFEAARATCPQAPAQSTANGGHLLFRLPEGTKAKNTTGIDLDGGMRADLRTEGGYIVVAPSVHASGARYEWTVPLPPAASALPELPANWAASLSSGNGELTQATQCNSSNSSYPSDTVTQAAKSHRCQRGESLSLTDSESQEVEAAIKATLPKGEGKRHEKILQLARRLKAIPTIDAAFETRPVLVRPIVDDWYTRACNAVKIKDSIEINWPEFMTAWANIQYPIGAQLAEALERAKASNDPRPAAWAEHMGITNESFRLLAALCIELSERGTWENGVFPLACRIAGKAVGTSPETARAWLAALVAQGFLERISEGKPDPHSGIATEYRVRPPAQD